MKQDFIDLIDQIDMLGSKFHKLPTTPGVIMPNPDIIHDVPEFQNWIQKIQFELQEIVDAIADTFASETLNVSKGKWSGWHDKNDFNELKNKLLTMREHLDKYYPMGGVEMKDKAEKPSKIFISHASKDKEYVAKIIELLDNMGLTSNEVFCSSFTG